MDRFDARRGKFGDTAGITLGRTTAAPLPEGYVSYPYYLFALEVYLVVEVP